ncbi:hypothetical protein ACN9OK_11720, partial [Glaesserella parasuis]|uniref:hypothetical protein n=1 Tax=Glaesserella parasuis TaxID=738 RepID=UPI003B681C2B
QAHGFHAQAGGAGRTVGSSGGFGHGKGKRALTCNARNRKGSCRCTGLSGADSSNAVQAVHQGLKDGNRYKHRIFYSFV